MLRADEVPEPWVEDEFIFLDNIQNIVRFPDTPKRIMVLDFEGDAGFTPEAFMLYMDHLYQAQSRNLVSVR